MRRILIVGDHPSLHRGFSTVGRHIARYLHQSGRWHVHYVGRYPRAAAASGEPYEVVDADRWDDPHDDDGERLSGLLRSAILSDLSGSRMSLLLSIGTARDQHFVVDRLDDLGLRSRVRFVGYMPVNFAPLPPSSAALLSRIDVLVPFTAFAGRALAEVCPGPAPPAVSVPIPHGVDLDTFHPPEADTRRNTRRRFFGLDDDEATLIGYFGRNSGHKHPDLAVRIFASFARGEYARCGTCGRVTAFDCDPVDRVARVSTACPRCGSGSLERGTANEKALLYLHTELLSPEERRHSGGWDVERLATRLGVRPLVRFDRSLRIGEGIDPTDLAARMGACDIHLLPFEGGGWELTVLETAACGVANVITDFGAPPEYAAPFAELVPTAARVLGPEGMRGFIDVGYAVDALLRLVNQPGDRQRLALNGPRVASAHSWTVIGRSWDDALTALAS